MDYKALTLIGSSSPHIRTRDGAGHIMGEVLIALVLPLAFGVYNFGPRALAAARMRSRRSQTGRSVSCWTILTLCISRGMGSCL